MNNAVVDRSYNNILICNSVADSTCSPLCTSTIKNYLGDSCIVCCYPCHVTHVNPGGSRCRTKYEQVSLGLQTETWYHRPPLYCCSCRPFDCISRPRPHTLPFWPCFSSPYSTISLALLFITTTRHDEQDGPYPPCRRGRQSWIHLLPGPDHRGWRVRHCYGLQVTFSPWL